MALAPVFVALAGLCATAWRRAGLATAGFLWLVCGEALSGDDLLFGRPDGTAPRGEWEGSVLDAASDALWPIVNSPVIAVLVVSVAFALLLPVLVRGRWVLMAAAGAAVWGVGLAICLGALGDLLAAYTELDQARGAVAGSVLAALVAFAVTVMAPPVPGEEPVAALP